MLVLLSLRGAMNRRGTPQRASAAEPMINPAPIGTADVMVV